MAWKTVVERARKTLTEIAKGDCHLGAERKISSLPGKKL
jgi:hypothetical protein